MLINIVDNLEDSQFITPAIVDRDPVTIAIGTEGSAPVLARAIKALIETQLSTNLGELAKIGKSFRDRASNLPHGRIRRDFWSDFYFKVGPQVYTKSGPTAAKEALAELHYTYQSCSQTKGHVAFVGAGPGNPELLTLRARALIDKADIILHDRLVTPEILDLARREATIVNVGKTGFGPSMAQNSINTLICDYVGKGANVVRLKGGDPTIFGRLDEELDACERAQISWSVVPGITAASAAAASIGRSLTRRHRNTSVKFLSGQDINGLAEHDWSNLARPNQIVAFYMSTNSARYIQGRLLMHNAASTTPITLVENASRANEKFIATTLANLTACHKSNSFTGPVLSFYGLLPRDVAKIQPSLPEKEYA